MKKVKLKLKDELIIHPSITQVTSFAQSFNCLFNESLLKRLSSLITRSFHIETIELFIPAKQKNVFAMFSPIPIIIRLENEIIERPNTAFKYAKDELTNHEIESRAWTSILTLIMMSPDQTSVLNQLLQELNTKVPKNVLNQFFGASRISQSLLAEFTGHDVNTIKAQRRNQTRYQKSIDLFDGFPTNMDLNDLDGGNI